MGERRVRKRAAIIGSVVTVVRCAAYTAAATKTWSAAAARTRGRRILPTVDGRRRGRRRDRNGVKDDRRCIAAVARRRCAIRRLGDKVRIVDLVARQRDLALDRALMLDLVRQNARDGGGPLLVQCAQERRVRGRLRRLILKQQRRDQRLPDGRHEMGGQGRKVSKIFVILHKHLKREKISSYKSHKRVHNSYSFHRLEKNRANELLPACRGFHTIPNDTMATICSRYGTWFTCVQIHGHTM